jgi:hypothetical protein
MDLPALQFAYEADSTTAQAPDAAIALSLEQSQYHCAYGAS